MYVKEAETKRKGHLVWNAWRGFSDAQRLQHVHDAQQEIANAEAAEAEAAAAAALEMMAAVEEKAAAAATAATWGADGDEDDTERPDPKTYEWSRQEWKEWKQLHPLERLPYVQFGHYEKAKDRGVNGNKLIEDWKALPRNEVMDMIKKEWWYDEDDASVGFQIDEDEDDGSGGQKGAEKKPSPVIVNSPIQDQFGDPAWKPEGYMQKAAIEAPLRNKLQLLGQGKWKFTRCLYHRKYNPHPNQTVETSNCLYVSFDQNGLAIDRLVVKHIICSYNISYSRDILHNLARSFARWPDHKHIHKQRGFALESTRFMWPGLFVYSEYCPHGSLDDIVYTKYTQGVPENDTYDQIPEPFIWVVLLGMAEALYFLDTGMSYSDRAAESDRDPNWKSIHHADIKPHNIFLDLPSAPYIGYPTPKLADFDNSLELGDNGTATKKQLGTEGWTAPEILVGIDQFGQTKPPTSRKTDIFVLGLVIWEMMHSKLGVRDLSRMRSPNNAHLMQNMRHRSGLAMDEGHDDWQASYSTGLISVVNDCLDVDPNVRPSAWLLIRMAQTGLERMERLVGKVPGEDFWSGMSGRLRYGRDEFPLGKPYEFRKRQAEADQEAGADKRQRV